MSETDIKNTKKVCELMLKEIKSMNFPLDHENTINFVSGCVVGLVQSYMNNNV